MAYYLKQINFKGASFEDAIYNFMKDNFINEISFKFSFGGGYSLRFIKHNKIIERINIFKKETCIKILKRLKINKEFKICKRYKTPLIKSLDIETIYKNLNNDSNMEMIKIYYDTKKFLLFDPCELKENYIFLLKSLSNETSDIKEIQNKFNEIVNNSFKEIASKYNGMFKGAPII